MAATAASQEVAARYQTIGEKLETRAKRAATLAGRNPGNRIVNRVAGDLDKIARCNLAMQMICHRMSGNLSALAPVHRRLAGNTQRIERIDVERLVNDPAYAKRMNKSTIRLHRCVAATNEYLTDLDSGLRHATFWDN